MSRILIDDVAAKLHITMKDIGAANPTTDDVGAVLGPVSVIPGLFTQLLKVAQTTSENWGIQSQYPTVVVPLTYPYEKVCIAALLTIVEQKLKTEAYRDTEYGSHFMLLTPMTLMALGGSLEIKIKEEASLVRVEIASVTKGQKFSWGSGQRSAESFEKTLKKHLD